MHLISSMSVIILWKMLSKKVVKLVELERIDVRSSANKELSSTAANAACGTHLKSTPPTPSWSCFSFVASVSFPS